MKKGSAGAGSEGPPVNDDEAVRREASRTYHREYNRRRFAEDPEFRERKNRNNRDYYRRRWEADPEFRERKREANRKSQERRQSSREGEPRLGRRRGPTEVDRHVGNRVRDRRRSLRIPIDEVADLLGVKRRQVALYERGETTLTSSQLHQLAQRFAVAVDWFFAELDDDGPTDSAAGEALPPESPETEEVARAFAAITDEVSRLRMLSLVQSLSEIRN